MRVFRNVARAGLLDGNPRRQVDVDRGDVVAVDQVHGSQVRHREARVDSDLAVAAVGNDAVLVGG
jgi:hypothetical protein